MLRNPLRKGLARTIRVGAAKMSDTQLKLQTVITAGQIEDMPLTVTMDMRRSESASRALGTGRSRMTLDKQFGIAFNDLVNYGSRYWRNPF